MMIHVRAWLSVRGEGVRYRDLGAGLRPVAFID
jgi:hypothetical protein